MFGATSALIPDGAWSEIEKFYFSKVSQKSPKIEKFVKN
jgi:hypothetical protein